MASPEFDRILRKTLEDYRLSRGEKRVLLRILEELHPDEQQLGVLRHQAFAIARGEIDAGNAQGVLDWLEEITKALVQPPPDGPQRRPEDRACFSPGDQCVRAINSLLNRARRCVDICVFTITDDRISAEILGCHHRGVQVRIITDNEKAGDLGSDVDRLQAAGLKVRIDRSPFHMHHKYALFDRESLLTGSYNWTRTAARENEENFIVTSSRQLVAAFAKHFDNLWKELK